MTKGKHHRSRAIFQISKVKLLGVQSENDVMADEKNGSLNGDSNKNYVCSYKFVIFYL